jgi:hypothetical protein
MCLTHNTHAVTSLLRCWISEASCGGKSSSLLRIIEFIKAITVTYEKKRREKRTTETEQVPLLPDTILTVIFLLLLSFPSEGE